MPFIPTSGYGPGGTIITQGYGTIAAPTSFELLSVSVTPTYLEFVFNSPVAPLTLQAADPAFWAITGPTSVSATSLQETGYSVLVYTTEHLNGGSYTMTFPITGLNSVYGPQYNGVPTYVYTASAVSPVASQAQVIDSEHVRVIFSEAVVTADALTTSNYVITPTLSVLSVSQETSNTYVITTGQQTSGLPYLLTIYNVRDLAGNVV